MAEAPAPTWTGVRNLLCGDVILLGPPHGTEGDIERWEVEDGCEPLEAGDFTGTWAFTAWKLGPAPRELVRWTCDPNSSVLAVQGPGWIKVRR